MPFPQAFTWGVATSAYQVEGAVDEDGRGPSIWDTFCHTPGHIAEGHTGDVACDHYHRYPQDIALMKRLGVTAYRFSIAWPRLFPQGGGPKNPKGFDFYHRLIDALLEAEITPFVTLYHWDLPEALQQKGGWLKADTARYFADYAAAAFAAFGDRVSHWITLNEPFVVAVEGHGRGTHAPGLAHPQAALLAGHQQLFAHGLALQAFREIASAGDLGLTLNFSTVYAGSARAEDREAQRRVDELLNGWFLEPIVAGHYPETVQTLLRAQGLERLLDDEVLSLVHQPIDFLGVNYYSPARVAADATARGLGVRRLPPQGETTQMGWEIFPRGLVDLLRVLQHKTSLPLYITENGAAFPDSLDAHGRIHDRRRIDYIRRHLRACAQAIDEGVDLRGYFLWSLLDNFEWALGYTRRFGITYVDFESQHRFPKDSFAFYQEVIAQKGQGIDA